MERCEWPKNNELMQKYHDNEWGVPLHDDQKLFEFLLLDTFQAGLSWSTILNKRENFRKAFDNFNAETIAKYQADKIAELLQNEGIIRNKLKILASITNAQNYLRLQKAHGTFSQYIWQFTNYKTIQNKHSTLSEIPVSTPESDKMSKALRKEGFKFVGTTICYAFMQAAGMVNDHTINCFRHSILAKIP